MAPRGKRKTLMRSLGEFVGHVAKAVKTDPAKQKREVRRETTVEERETSEGTVTLRRTTIEEIEINPKASEESR